MRFFRLVARSAVRGGCVLWAFFLGLFGTIALLSDSEPERASHLFICGLILVCCGASTAMAIIGDLLSDDPGVDVSAIQSGASPSRPGAASRTYEQLMQDAEQGN